MTSYSLFLESYPDSKKLDVLLALREALGVGHTYAKELAETPHAMLLCEMPHNIVKNACAPLLKAGATIKVNTIKNYIVQRTQIVIGTPKIYFEEDGLYPAPDTSDEDFAEAQRFIKLVYEFGKKHSKFSESCYSFIDSLNEDATKNLLPEFQEEEE